MRKRLLAGMIAGTLVLSGCESVSNTYNTIRYRLNNPNDSKYVRGQKNDCVNNKDYLACRFIIYGATYLPYDLREDYRKLDCKYGDKKACEYGTPWDNTMVDVRETGNGKRYF